MIDPHDVGHSLGTLIRDHLGSEIITTIVDLIGEETLGEILEMIGESIGEIIAVEVVNRLK